MTLKDRNRTLRAAVLVVVVGLVGAVAGVGLADSSPGGHDAGAWPTLWAPYRFADGSIVTDEAGDSSPGQTDLVMGPAGDEGTLLTAFDGTNLFFRLRLGDEPLRTPDDFRSTVWLVGLGVGGVFQGGVGFDGKPPAGQTESVYVVNADGSSVIPVYEDPFTDGPTNDSRGVRGTEQDAAGNWFIDFQVPIEVVYAGTGVEPGDVIQLFAGTGTANNLSVVNKDWIVGSTVDFTGLDAVTVRSARLELRARAVPISGAHPPVVGATSNYDLVLEAENSGFNVLTGLSITDTMGAGVMIESITESSGGTITSDGTTITWEPADLGHGGRPSATISVSITPEADDVGLMLALDQGVVGSGEDALIGTITEASASPVEVGPVGAATGLSFVGRLVPPGPAVAGDGITRSFQLTASNDGPSTLTGVVIEDSVDDRLLVTDTNCAALGGSDSTVGNLVRCEGLGLDPAGSLDLVIDFEVPSTTDSTTIENQATLVANELAVALPSSTASLVVSESVALSVEKVFLPATLAAGSSGGSFAVTVTNGGLSDADTVRVTDVIDSHLLVTSAIMDGGGCSGAAALECVLDHLGAGASAELTVTFDLAATAVPGTIVANTAQVTSDESPSVSSPAASLVVADFDPLPPIANDDSASTASGTAVTVVVLGNDGDPHGDALVVQYVSKPGSGSAGINAEGTVTYTPEPGFVGQDSFTYTVCESDHTDGLCDEASVIVDVTKVDHAPILEPGKTTIEWMEVGETPAPLPITDPEGQPITAELTTGALPPGLSLLTNGTFTGRATEAGAFIFLVKVCDPPGHCTTFVYALVVESP